MGLVAVWAAVGLGLARSRPITKAARKTPELKQRAAIGKTTLAGRTKPTHRVSHEIEPSQIQTAVPPVAARELLLAIRPRREPAAQPAALHAVWIPAARHVVLVARLPKIVRS